MRCGMCVMDCAMRVISVCFEGTGRKANVTERQGCNGFGGWLWRRPADAPYVAGKEEEDLRGQDTGGWQASA